MSRSLKIALAILGGIVVLCICGLVGFRTVRNLIFDRMVVEDPAESAAIAHTLLDYNLPPGYQEQMSLDLFVGKIVVFGSESPGTGGGPRPFIMVVQMSVEETLDPNEVRRSLEQGFQQAGPGESLQLNLVKTERTNLRGQSVNLYTFEGEDGTGQYFRQIMTDPFDGKSGKVIVAVHGPIASWDKRSVDAFFDSIR